MRQVCYKIRDKDCKKFERFYNSLVKKYDSFENKAVLNGSDAEKIEELESLINKLSRFFFDITKKEKAA